MKSITENRYICEICLKIYPNPQDAAKCELGHDMIYVAFQREDLKRLVGFINTGEVRLLTPSLIATLEKYSRIQSEPVARSNMPDFD